MSLSLRAAIGSFRILGRRALTVGQNGFLLWTRTGERAVVAVASGVEKKAHANECDERQMAQEIREIFSDGKVTPDEQRRLARYPQRLSRCAERSHDITETIRL